MGDEQAARAGDDHPSERFPCSSRVFGLVTLVTLAVAFVLVAVDGLSVGHLAVLAAIVLIGLGTWLTMVRPSVATYEDHIMVRNALTDTLVPWHLVESVEVRQVLVIRTGDRAVHGLAVGRTARQQMREGRAGGRSGRGVRAAPSFGGDAVARVDYADFVAKRLDHLASANRTKSRRLERLDRRWRSAEALAVAGVAVAFIVLLVIVLAG